MRNSSKREKIFIGIGLLLIVFGIIFNEWLLVALLSPDGAIESSTRTTIWLFDFSMILIGLSLIKYSNRIHAKQFREEEISLIMILAGGILLRIIVYIFL